MKLQSLRIAVVAIVLMSMASSAQAAPLSRLLGASQRVEARRSTPVRTIAPTSVATASSQPTINRGGQTEVPGQLLHATPRFPILRKAIILYLLFVLQNPYR
ncbi:hypothetical protein GC163_12115 [bacterium]|nr:hypothetical protein [bacterium]